MVHMRICFTTMQSFKISNLNWNKMGYLNMQVVFYVKCNWELIDNIIYSKSGDELCKD